MWRKVVKNETGAERADQKQIIQINNLPLAWQFALKAIKLQMFGDKTRLAPYYNMFFLSRYSEKTKQQLYIF